MRDQIPPHERHLERATLPRRVDKPLATNGERLLLGLAIAYVFWFVATPWQRFPLFTELRFERLLIIVYTAALLVYGRLRFVKSSMSALVLLFYVTLELSHLLTPRAYESAGMALVWADTYWKIVFVYFLLACTLTSEAALRAFACGTLMVFSAYWAYSLADYANGGSYVWQQGVPRLIGVWFPPGVGAANFTGVAGVLMIPFSIYAFETARSNWWRLSALGTLGIALAVVALSGTRGAIVASALLLAYAFRTRILSIRWLLAVVLASLLAIAVLPPQLIDRYSSLLPFLDQRTGSQLIDDFSQEQAAISAESRLDGFWDGMRLFAKRPVLGYGPGSSAAARTEVSVGPVEEGLELHNLYGQLFGETGLFGATLFMLLVSTSALAARRYRATGTEFADAGANLVIHLILGSLLYGLVAHTLYRFYWIILFAMAHAMLVPGFATSHGQSPVDASSAAHGFRRSRRTSTAKIENK